MAFCKNCGAQLEEEQKFCTNCGAKVEQEETTATAPVQDFEVKEPVFEPVVAEPKQTYAPEGFGGEEKDLSFVEAFVLFWKNYAKFDGRSRRKEYWYMVLWNIIISIAISVLKIKFLGPIFTLASLIPGIALGVRRLHDIGKSGWYLLFSFIPFVGAIILIVWFATDGERAENQYGSNPKFN